MIGESKPTQSSRICSQKDAPGSTSIDDDGGARAWIKSRHQISRTFFFICAPSGP
jgi:hypothetical protein